MIGCFFDSIIQLYTIKCLHILSSVSKRSLAKRQIINQITDCVDRDWYFPYIYYIIESWKNCAFRKHLLFKIIILEYCYPRRLTSSPQRLIFRHLTSFSMQLPLAYSIFLDSLYCAWFSPVLLHI